MVLMVVMVVSAVVVNMVVMVVRRGQDWTGQDRTERIEAICPRKEKSLSSPKPYSNRTTACLIWG